MVITRLYLQRLVSQSWRLVLSASLLGALLALVFSLTTPLQYSSTERVLIIQENLGTTDPYTAIKFTENIANSMTQLLYTSTFFDNIMLQAKGFDQSVFPTDEIAKRKAWRNAIDTSVTAGTGIMSITAYSADRDQARILVDATGKELALQAPNYFGSNVRVQVIDQPLASSWFARPNFLRNGLFGLMVGFFLGLIWTLWRPRERHLQA